MQIGVIGLGRMGGNIVRRLVRGGHSCVVYDRVAAAGDALAKEKGVTAAADLRALVAGLTPPRAVWVMLPAGPPTDECVTQLGALMSAGDSVTEADLMRLSSWASEVALAIGAVTPCRAMIQASATSACLTERRAEISSSAARMRSPRALR